MGRNNREIEAKLLAVGVKGLQTMVDRIEKWFDPLPVHGDVVVGNATDLYWKAPANGRGDFIRLRKNPDGAQITVKSTDRGSNVDRVEIDLEVDDYNQAKELMLEAHGEPMEAVTKKYFVFFLENHDTNISVYQVKNDDRVFVEIEARTMKRLKQLVQAVMDGSGTEYQWIKSSIYDIFVRKVNMVSASIQSFLEKA